MNAQITRRAAVLGSPIAHSLSPVLHNAGYRALGWRNWEYVRIDTPAGSLARTVEQADESFRGFSVTMPGKFEALDFAARATDRARIIGSANTLVRQDEGWLADNTDCLGVEGALGQLDTEWHGHAVVVGAGGTARPAVWALAQRGVRDIVVINRSDRSAEFEELAGELGVTLHFEDFAADLAELTESACVLISTVPASAAKQHADQLARTAVLDVIYDPWPTPLIQAAQQRGLSTVGGHVMLAHQAFPQFEWFTGHQAPRVEMFAALHDALS
ncbi:shikimate dehydrogenase [Corynebacterium tapiri]|uniref:shikimate dehydrogenase (NADP(+)) n=1 Tax=Corynebacterium tapiri TaxID=1448266 RepID=A0A5C4U4W3_9CORY|nr:shikimate dehydrogenase [Corynebacterium tapiri]TNL97769.1 shikimate dehydrogenase [Corynebacterium tapiri]